jgi:hypothetical protein
MLKDFIEDFDRSRKKYLEITNAAASHAEKMARRNYTERLQCIVKDADRSGAWGELGVISLGDQVPYGWKLLTEEPFPAHLAFAEWPRWIRIHQPSIWGYGEEVK